MTKPRRKPTRVRCEWCWTYVTGRHIGAIDGGQGWGCKDADRCSRKGAAADRKAGK